MSNTLDEILKAGFGCYEVDGLWFNGIFEDTQVDYPETKQAILQWVADEVVGIDAGYIGHHGDILLQKQKAILKQHGWKEGDA